MKREQESISFISVIIILFPCNRTRETRETKGDPLYEETR